MNRIKWKLLSALMILYTVLSANFSCHIDKDEVNVSPNTLNFSSAAGESLSFSISSNCAWTVSLDSQGQEFLSLSTTAGTGDMSDIRVSTKTSNKTSSVRTAVITVSGDADGPKTINVSQESGRSKARADVVDCLEMTSGMACDVMANGDTKYYYIALVEKSTYDSMSPTERESKIQSMVPDYPEGMRDSRFEYTYNSFMAWYKNLKSDTNYYLVTLAYDSDGNPGELVEKSVTTKSSKSQPSCGIKDIRYTEVKSETGETGYVYEWYVEKNGFAVDYMTYACASSKTFPSYERFDNGGNKTDNGVILAWQLYKEYRTNQNAEINTNFNDVQEDGGRETFYTVPQVNNATMSVFKMDIEKDQYLQVVVWARSNQSGVSQFSGEINMARYEKIPPVKVTTVKADDITTSGATLYGSIGGATVTLSAGFYYGVSSSEMNMKSDEVSTNGDYSVKINNLSPDTKYYYMAYAQDDKNISKGDVLSFTTKASSQISVSNVEIPASTIGANSAVANASISGSASVSEKGFCFSSTNGAPSKANSTYVVSSSSGTSFSATMSNLTPNTKYYVRAYAVNSTGTVYSTSATAFTTLEDSAGPEAVDLGLSVPWASFNVGASSPSESGGFYAWGEIEEKSDYSSSTYKLSDEKESYCTAGDDIRGTQYDVATAKWGDKWHMPSTSEVEELVEKCAWSAETRDGVKGYKVTGPNGNSIFLPMSGYKSGTTISKQNSVGWYYSGTTSKCSDEDWPYTYPVFLEVSQSADTYVCHRFNGCTVRPVYGDIQSESLFSRDDKDWGGSDINL